MTTYRIDGFKFNRANLKGIDADCVKGLNAFLASREAMINSITTESYACAGGPFHGQLIELETTSGKACSAALSFGKWSGFYEVIEHKEATTGAYFAAVWRGNEALAPQDVQFYGLTKAPKIAKSNTLKKGFTELDEFLARMAEDPETTTHAGQEMAIFRIGRSTYRVLNTPAVIERLRANILKNKKWFADKFLQTARPAQSAEDIARDLAQVAAIDTAASSAALSELGTVDTSTAAQDDTRELATVDADECAAVCEYGGQDGSGQTIGHGSTPPAARATAAPGQQINSKSGHWRARFYIGQDGAPRMAFSVASGAEGDWSFESGRERMKALQVIAKNADTAARQAAPVVPAQPIDPAAQGVFTSANAPGEQIPAPVSSGQFESKPDTEANRVGLGVYYRGDYANAGGSGAITAVGQSNYYGATVDVTLESGVQWRALRWIDFDGAARSSFRLDGKMHGAPYLAQLAGAAATVKAQASAAQEQATKAHAAALVDLVAQYPQLKRSETSYAGGKLAAVNMRTLLKAAFKGIKFSVTSDYDSVRVNWTDGPTDAEVNAIIGRFDIGASDIQTDYFYTISTAFSELFGGCQYLSTSRALSDALILRALGEYYPDASTRPSLEDYRHGRGGLDYYDKCGERHRFDVYINAKITAPKAAG